MNLTIDIGNTRSKIALFQGSDLKETFVLNQEDAENDLSSFLKGHPQIQHIICSTVGAPLKVLEDQKEARVLLNLDENTPLPLENKYNSPETLGADRISNAVGAATLIPNSNVLVIDAGTCITMDFVNQENQYLGGSISNGIQLRFRSLNTFTENLPLIGHDSSKQPELIGKSTADSIRSGVVNGLVAELCGLIEEYNKKFTSLKLIFTGGDADYILEVLRNRIDIKKNEIFANPNLVHVGLNAILNFYVESKIH